MRIEATAVVLSLLLGGLLNTAAAQRLITDRPSPKPAPRPAPKAVAPPAERPSIPKSAVKKPAHRLDPLADRLLSPDEGLSVIAAALGAPTRHASRDDCSRLVHDIYERAGFSYPYANSWDLYTGSHYFRRVRMPQSGDLVVWQGHVGIVVSPKEHLFFSRLTSSGQDTSSYDTPYWRRRGPARFLRYLKPEGEDRVERAAAPQRRRRPPVREVAAVPPERRAGSFDVASPDDDPSPSLAAETRPAAEDTPALLNARRPRPEQVRQAILMQLLHAAPALSDAQAPALSRPLIVFDDLRVERVRLDGDQGWAEVRIQQMGAVRSGRAEVVRRTERAFWTLRRRDHADWEVVTPQEATYLPRKAAVSVIAHQLDLLPDHPGDAQAGAPQKKSLARLLDVLLEP